MADESADKRSVTTDALTTLGTIIGNNEKRDAIHIAVEPVEAAEPLAPGEHITIKQGKAYGVAIGQGLGIVDPFLMKNVAIGEKFWFLMYPRQVRSLRHVWEHPSFPNEEVIKPNPNNQLAIQESEQWLRNFCNSSGNCPSYGTVMGRILEDDHDEEYLHFNTDASGDIPDEFWNHVEKVTGKVFPRAKWFSCSC